MTRPVKVGFVLLSNSRRPIPSTRIAVLNMFPFLRQAHFEPQIVFEPGPELELEPERDAHRPDVSGVGPRIIAEGFDIVVFQKVMGPSVEALVRELAQAGVRTVFCVCDVVDPVMAQLTDATVTVTDFLKSLYPAALQHKIHVVHDGIEHPELERLPVSRRSGTRANPLRAVLVTSASLATLPQIVSPPSWLSVTIVGLYAPGTWQRMRDSRWALATRYRGDARRAYLRFLINPRIRCVAWNAASVYDHMRSADLGIIPVDDQPGADSAEVQSWQVKSENRLSMKMGLGLPVIATPIPAYRPLVRQGENGFLADTPGQWMTCLETLRDPLVRERVGREARASVLQRYSREEQARLLIAVLASLVVR